MLSITAILASIASVMALILGNKLLILDLIKCFILTLIFTNIAKAIGQKEIGSLIKGTGLLMCGLNIIKIFEPIANFFMKK